MFLQNNAFRVYTLHSIQMSFFVRPAFLKMWQSAPLKKAVLQINTTRQVCNPSFKSRRTGRTGGNCVLPRQAWRYEVSLGRNFQRDFGKRFGFGMG